MPEEMVTCESALALQLIEGICSEHIQLGEKWKESRTSRASWELNIIPKNLIEQLVVETGTDSVLGINTDHSVEI